jgi:signal transduction histidine kinase
MAAAVSASRRRLPGVAVALFATTYAVAAVVVPSRATTVPLSTYASASTTAYAVDLAAGLGLLAAGVLAWAEPRARRLGLLAILAAVAWFGPDWEGWREHGPALVRSLGALLTPLFLAVVVHLVLAYPSGRLGGWFARAAVVAVYGVAIVVSLGRALFRDPLLDPYCWRNCRDNSFLVHAGSGIAGALDDVWIEATLAIGLLLVGTAGWRLAIASRPARRGLWPGLVPGMVVGAATAAYGVALLRTRVETPRSAEFMSVFVALSLSVLALAAGVAWAVLAARRQRATVSRLALELGEAPPPGTLRNALSGALGDPTLEVAYWLPDSLRFVDGEGRVVKDPGAKPGRAATTIARRGRPVAVVTHEAELLESSELERELGSALRLAVENERLQAEILAQVEDLRASRARIVETGDAERRRLERDLHDGAQQRLLALFYELRLAMAAAQRDGDHELGTTLASVSAETDAALDELRDLAHGIYPAILAEAGLALALETLADAAPLPVELGAVPRERYGSAVETAAYVAVTEAIEDASRRQATFASVQMTREDDQLVVTVHDDGTARRADLVHVADRIGALGGALDIAATTLRAEIPCVS